MCIQTKLLEVHHLHKSYEKDGMPVKALNGISFDVFSGEFLGIMGASGSGKTTLLNCIATILKPTSGQILLSGTPAVSPESRLMDIAGLLGIQDVLLKFPAQMSGGQKQRVAAARCLITEPEIILADEPTGALDTRSSRQLMEKLQEVNQKRRATILMVTHNPSAASFCSRILFIQDGTVFHELRRRQEETQDGFYQRILNVMAQMGGGSANVL
ncbi:MAG TPA: ATP-binding cassette domain-containing protein [Candidatus Scybalocola faecigallinarum]|uniref:ATP-binding cassette domain-containing protein n=1 Tax=Candidatus Scybalocola faecigallinarum TaxID=2840941 RepID=A0A9D1F4I0_9FIRM|nr:ATP-binding cassette domain-containing protein [Candidatus Scybalocola faecigallinarum]